MTSTIVKTQPDPPELVKDIGDRRRCCLTCWEPGDWQALDAALIQQELPECQRVQPYFRYSHLAGKSYYFNRSDLDRF